MAELKLKYVNVAKEIIMVYLSFFVLVAIKIFESRKEVFYQNPSVKL